MALRRMAMPLVSHGTSWKFVSFQASRACSSDQSGRLGQKGGVQSEEVPDPPSAAAAVGLMGFGAVGAVLVAAVGVYGVLQMSLMVAQGTGRSIMADKQTRAEQTEAANAGSQPIMKP